MRLHIGIDIGSAHTKVAVHAPGRVGQGGRLTVARFATVPDRFLVDLDATVWRGGADWADVALVACGTSMAEPMNALQSALPSALRQAGLHGRVYFMQPDASLSTQPWNDVRSAPVAGMLAAAVLSRLIGEAQVLAVDIGATGARCALIRDGQLAHADRAVALEPLEAPHVEVLRRHCERRGQDPQACTLLAFGGGGAALAVELARGLGCARTIVPQHAGAFSAWGLLQAELRFSHSLPRSAGDEAGAVFEQLRARVLREVAAEGLAEDDLRFEQTEEGGHCRLTASSGVSRSRLPIRPATASLAFVPMACGTAGIDADQLLPGARVAGPAQLRGETGALQLPEQSMLTVDSYGNLVIELALEGCRA